MQKKETTAVFILEFEKKVLNLLIYAPMVAGIVCYIYAVKFYFDFKDMPTGALESAGILFPFIGCNFLSLIGTVLCLATAGIKKSLILGSMGCLVPIIIFFVTLKSCAGY